MTMFDELDKLRALEAYQLLRSGEEIRCMFEPTADNMFRLTGDRFASGKEVMALMDCGIAIVGPKAKGRITTLIILASSLHPAECIDAVEEAIFNRHLWLLSAKADYEHQLNQIEEWYGIWMRDALKVSQS